MAREWTRKSIEELARVVYNQMGGGGGESDDLYITPYAYGDAQAYPMKRNGLYDTLYNAGIFSAEPVTSGNDPIFSNSTYDQYRRSRIDTWTWSLVDWDDGYVGRNNFWGFSCIKGGTDYNSQAFPGWVASGVVKDPEYYFQISIIPTNGNSQFFHFIDRNTAINTFVARNISSFTYGHNIAQRSDTLDNPLPAPGPAMTIPIIVQVNDSDYDMTVYTYNKNATLNSLSTGSGDNAVALMNGNNVVGLKSDFPNWDGNKNLMTNSVPYFYLPTNSVFLSYLQNMVSDVVSDVSSYFMFLHIPTGIWGNKTVEQVVDQILDDFNFRNGLNSVTIDSYI